MGQTYSIIGGKASEQITVGLFGVPPVSHEEIAQQARDGGALGLPLVEQNVQPYHDRKLAVIGGGPSINAHREKIRAWDGDIWTINGAYHWCKAFDIKETTFVATDPHEIVAKWVIGVKKAIVATRSHPHVFKLLEEQNAEVQTFSLDHDRQVAAGSSTATAAIHLGIMRGYRDMTFFGCESSYPPGFTHGYMTEKREAEMIIRCNGEEFYTAPDYLMQAIEMGELLRLGKNGLHEESGGLLRAMIEGGGEYSIMWVSQGMMEMMTPVADAMEKQSKDEEERKKVQAAYAELEAWPCAEVSALCDSAFERARGTVFNSKGNGNTA